MTAPSVRLATETLRVEPGAQVQTTLTLSNVADIVEGFRLDVLGDEVAGFATVTPAEVQVYPGQDATAVLVFSPPEGSGVAGGTLPFGVRVSSVVDEDAVAVVEGDLEVGRVFGISARTVPVTSTGRWRGRHLVTLTNWGNAAVTLAVSATDPDETLAFLVLPDHLTLPVGASGSARIEVRTRAPFLRGTSVRRPFTVVAEPDPPDPRPVTALSRLVDDRRATVDSAFQQKPILSRAVVLVATALLLVLGGGVTYALTRPASDPGSVLATGIPDQPALTAAAAAQTITLQWEPQTGVDGYDLFEMIDGARGPLTPLPGGQNVHLVADLVPASTHCYALQARRGTSVSPLSPSVCATTAPAATPADGSPAATTTEPTVPTVVDATGPTDTGGVPVPTGPSGESGPSGSSEPVTPVPTASTGPATSDPSASATPTTTSGGTPGDTVPPGAHVAVLAVFAAADVDAAGRAAARRDQLQERYPDTPVSVLDSADHPSMVLGGAAVVNDSIVVYAGPFPTAAAVTAFCTAGAGDPDHLCIDAQPRPTG